MSRCHLRRAAAICLALAFALRSHGEDLLTPSLRGDDRAISLPYAFYNDSFGLAAGYVHAVNGFPQPQSALMGTVIAGTEGSAMGFLMGYNLRPFRVERLFFDPILSVGYFGDTDVYADGNQNFPDERAGSNESDRRDFITGSGWDNFFRLRFRYLLPLGDGRNQVLPRYRFSDGLLADGASGGHAFNPWRSGRTFVEMRPFYRSQSINNDDIDAKNNTNGIDFSVFWDNRDYPSDPSRGQSLILKYTRDWGLANSSGSWASVGAEYDQYASLGETKYWRRRVLAFDVATVYSPTWEVESDGSISHRPPPFAGATLGGLWRMRGYPSQRYNDKASIYYSGELRLTSRWNPFDAWPALQERVGIDWIQIVPFGEIGRVAPHWNVTALHRDMRWDVGVGLRAWAKGLVVRADFAVSEESYYVQMMIGQPFQF